MLLCVYIHETLDGGAKLKVC